MNGDYIKLNRKMLDWEWFQDDKTFKVFMYCLLKANWKDGKFRGEVIPRGSFVTSRASLAAGTRLTERSVRTALEHLKSTNEITIKTTNKYTVITIENYAKYQDSPLETTNYVTNKQSDDRQTNDQQSTTIEEGKKERIYINNIYTANPTANAEKHTANAELFDKFWEAYPKKKDKKSAMKAFAKLKCDEDLFEKIMSALAAQKKSEQWMRDGGQFIPYPATWLNGERWEDEIETVPQKPEKKIYTDGWNPR